MPLCRGTGLGRTPCTVHGWGASLPSLSPSQPSRRCWRWTTGSGVDGLPSSLAPPRAGLGNIAAPLGERSGLDGVDAVQHTEGFGDIFAETLDFSQSLQCGWNMLVFVSELIDCLMPVEHRICCPLLRLLTLTEFWNLLVFEVPLDLLVRPRRWINCPSRGHTKLRSCQQSSTTLECASTGCWLEVRVVFDVTYCWWTLHPSLLPSGRSGLGAATPTGTRTPAASW